jgi:poly-beta-1,6-N-acetyl-D-glucosamine synthase
MIFLFWILIFIIAYHYVLFPLIIFLLATVFPKPVRKGEYLPRVSLVIAAYNEEKILEQKIFNSFELEYPQENLEIIVVSDGSTDSTPQIAEKYSGKGVICLFDPPRRGKTAALNRALSIAKGDIVVFSDANSMYDRKAIKLLTRNFIDPKIGGVCGIKSIVKNVTRESSKGDSLFWDFESELKKMESQFGSISTGDGEIFAIRKELYKPIPEEVINDDTAITLDIIKKGYRVVYEPEAKSNEEASLILEDDFNVKARMVSGGYQTLSFYSKEFFPPKSFFAFQFLSHKVLRWIMPFILILLFLVNIFILHGLFIVVLLLQSLFYLTAIIGYLARKRRGTLRVLYVPLYYCLMNVAAFLGFFHYLRRRPGVSIWKKAMR